MIISNESKFVGPFSGPIEGVEYRVKLLDDNRYREISGKVGVIVKWADDNECYFKIGNDVYLIPVYEIDPKPMSGLFKVNYRDILKSRLFRGVIFEHGTESVKDISDFLGRVGVGFSSGEDLEYPYMEVNYRGYKMHVGLLSYLRSGDKVSLLDDPRAYHHLVNEFEIITGKNLWSILKILSYLELDLCSCGSRHQVWRELRKTGEVFLTCASCGYNLYEGREVFTYKLEDSLQNIIDTNAV